MADLPQADVWVEPQGARERAAGVPEPHPATFRAPPVVTTLSKLDKVATARPEPGMGGVRLGVGPTYGGR